jgi:hypothetical protein
VSISDLPYGFYELRIVVVAAVNETTMELADAAYDCSERTFMSGEEGCGVITFESQKLNFFEVIRPC